MVNKYVKMGVETSYGAGATTLSPVRATEFSISVDHNVIYLEDFDTYNPYDAVYGVLNVSDNFTMYAIYDSILDILEAVFGTKTPVDTNADNITDYYDFTLSVPKSLEVEVGTTDNVAYDMKGVLLTSIEASFDVKDVLKFTGNYVAKDITEVTHNPGTPTSSQPFIVWNTTISIATATVKAKEFSMTINRGINEDAYIIGSRYRDSIEYGKTEVSGSCTLEANELTEFKRAFFGSTTATTPQDTPTLADITITAKTPDASKTMTITIPAAIYPKGTLNITAADPLGKSFDWRLVGDNIQVRVDA